MEHQRASPKCYSKSKVSSFTCTPFLAIMALCGIDLTALKMLVLDRYFWMYLDNGSGFYQAFLE